MRKLLKSRKKSKHTTLQPTQFYESLYGTPSDFTGLNSSPLEYYSGTITDSPDSLLNQYQNSYQSACDRKIRIKIRAMIFADHIRKQA